MTKTKKLLLAAQQFKGSFSRKELLYEARVNKVGDSTWDRLRFFYFLPTEKRGRFLFSIKKTNILVGPNDISDIKKGFIRREFLKFYIYKLVIETNGKTYGSVLFDKVLKIEIEQRKKIWPERYI